MNDIENSAHLYLACPEQEEDGMKGRLAERLLRKLLDAIDRKDDVAFLDVAEVIKQIFGT